MNFWFDLKYAWRLFLKAPGYSFLSIVVVALSVGLALFVYCIDYSMEFKPLPYPDSARWISLHIAADKTATAHPIVDAFTYQELRKNAQNVHYLGAFARGSAVLSAGDASATLRTAEITPELLEDMHEPPLMGRTLNPADAQAGATPVMVLSYTTWKNYFAADPHIVGKQAQIDRQPVQIVGVMPRDFFTFEDFQSWRPLQLGNLSGPTDSAKTLAVLAELNPGQTIAQVLSETQRTVEQVNRGYPQQYDAGRHLVIVAASRMETAGTVAIMSMASFISVAVLLLGCLNISLIFFARLLERSKEIALRSALGSSRGRLLRQCLLESSFVVALGLVIGSVLAALAIDWAQGLIDFQAQIQATGRGSNDIVMHGVDLLAGVMAAVVVWLLSTLVPAWRIARQDSATVLAGVGKGSTGPGGNRLAGVLVGAQVLISSLLLVICANVVLSVSAELSKPTGLAPGRVLLSTYPTVFGASYAGNSDKFRYWDDLESTIKQRLPGAEVAYATAVPTDTSGVPVAVEQQEGANHQRAPRIPVNTVSEGYFDLLGIRLRSGRVFDSTDNESTQQVAVVDESTARSYWPKMDVLGQRVQIDPQKNGPWLTIVGVVSAVSAHYSDTVGVIYRPLKQVAPASFHVLVRMPTTDGEGTVAVTGAAFAVDRNLPLNNLQLLDQYLTATDSGNKSLVPGFTGIATVIIVLAAIGLFGLISRSVAQRTQEVGIRRAVGATQGQVIVMFLRQGLRYLIVGVVGGGVGVVLTDRLSGTFPNILDSVVPVSIAVFLLIGLVIFLASYVPTRRAVAMQPGDALRYE